MMQQMGALPTVGPGSFANGQEPVWGPTASSGGGDGSPEANKELLVSLVGALAGGDEPGTRALVADGFVDHSPCWGTRDLDSVLAAHAALRAAVPDVSFEVDRSNMVCEGDQVAAHSLVRGTHSGGPLFGAEPSGNELVWTHSDFVRVADGRVVERWSSTDMLTLFQQAGVLPSG
jgi:predicted ester cyclase